MCTLVAFHCSEALLCACCVPRGALDIVCNQLLVVQQEILIFLVACGKVKFHSSLQHHRLSEAPHALVCRALFAVALLAENGACEVEALGGECIVESSHHSAHACQFCCCLYLAHRVVLGVNPAVVVIACCAVGH